MTPLVYANEIAFCFTMIAYLLTAFWAWYALQ